MKATFVNERLGFTEDGDPIKDLGIGIPDHSYATIGWDWEPDMVADAFASALEKFGIHVTQDFQALEKNDEIHAFILSKKKLTKAEINRIAEQREEYGIDD